MNLFRRTTLIAACGGAVLLAPGGAALAAAPTPHQLSITAPSKIVFGKTATVSGKLTGSDAAGEDVTLLSDPFPFASFQPEASTQTGPAGGYAFVVAPTVNTKYMTRAKSKAPAESAEVLVKVAPKITLRVSDKTPAAGQKVKFSGTVAPEHDGQAVLLQRRKSDGTWRTMQTVLLVDAGAAPSTYSATRTINRGGRWRVVKRADADHARGQSPVRVLTLES